jgi:hypothetical protein
MMYCTSERTITRRWKEMGLHASKNTERALERDEVIRLVAEQMALDPSGKAGQNTIKKQIALRTGVHLKRLESYSILPKVTHSLPVVVVQGHCCSSSAVARSGRCCCTTSNGETANGFAL